MSLLIRGLHLDPARRPFKLSTVLGIIDKASQCHINALHLHLTDDQGIAVESSSLGFTSETSWSIKDQEAIYSACHQKRITVICEIDIPGHTTALRSLLLGKYKPEEKMGEITKGLISLDDLPKILSFYTEFADRFHCEYFHMGGDETRGAKRDYFQQLVNRVCEWGTKRNIYIIAWEDVLGKIDSIPDNLIIQKWKHRTFPPIAKGLEKIGNARVIYSCNYYLDTCIDVFTSYRTKIPVGALGCVACTWGELIDEHNIEATIFPALYLLGHRWMGNDDNPVYRLILESNRIGWIKTGNQATWKRRQWYGYNDTSEPRSTVNSTTETMLTSAADQYPLISRFLIVMANDFRRVLLGIQIPEDRLKRYTMALREAGCKTEIVDQFVKTIDPENFKKILRKIRLQIQPENAPLYKNGIRMVIRETLR